MLLLDGDKFLVREEEIFVRILGVPLEETLEEIFVRILGVPLEETLCSCPSDLLQSRSKEVSVWAEVRFRV